jgi:long-chain acyl-CoA synthetase
VVDERGYFKIVDRKKDMILVQRLQRVPERGRRRGHADARHPRMRAVGVPDAKAARPSSCASCAEHPNVTEADGARLLRGQPDRLQAAPKIVEFRTELPKTPSGKILRASCATRLSGDKVPSRRAAGACALR